VKEVKRRDLVFLDFRMFRKEMRENLKEKDNYENPRVSARILLK
jgi:hypothetical protein